MKLKALIQAEIDGKAAIRKAKKEGNDLMAVEAPTPEQKAALVAKVKELDALEAAQEQIEADLAVARRLQDAERHNPTVVVVGTNNADARPWGPTLHSDATPRMRAEARLAALGEWGIALRAATLGQGTDGRLFAAATGMGTAVPADGGFAVPLEVAAGIEYDMFQSGDLLSRVDARTIGGDSIAYNVIYETSRVDGSRQGGVLAYWVDQGTAPTASQTKLARVEMKLRKLGCLGYATDELVADAAALGAELQALFVNELVFGVEDAITEGSGAGAPLGYLNAPCLVSVAKETGQAAATIVGPNITKMWARLPARSRATSVWLANGDTIPRLAILTTPVGTAGFAYPYASVTDGGISLWGRPVVYTEYNATLGTVGDLVLIDLSKYRLIRKGGVEQGSSMHVLFTTDQMTYRAFYRCDGQMMPRAPLTPYKGSNTLSPVVVLATR